MLWFSQWQLVLPNPLPVVFNKSVKIFQQIVFITLILRVKNQRYWKSQDEDTEECCDGSNDLSKCWFWIIFSLTNSGDAHESPPEAVIEAPVCFSTLSQPIRGEYYNVSTNQREVFTFSEKKRRLERVRTQTQTRIISRNISLYTWPRVDRRLCSRESTNQKQVLFRINQSEASIL